MSVSPQTNTTLEGIASEILKHDNYCLCGHVSPDGDCMGSCLAIWNALTSIGKRATVLLAEDIELDEKFDIMPGVEHCVYAGHFEGPCDAFIALDVPTEKRMGPKAAELHSNAGITFTIDHHEVPERMSDLSFTDPDAPSTTVLAWKLLKLMDVELSKDIALCALAGLMTDTGSFQYQNADSESFLLASEMLSCGASPSKVSERFFQSNSLPSILIEKTAISNIELFSDGQGCISHITAEELQEVGATKADCENLVSLLRSIRGVKVACMLREQKDGIRGSLRSKGSIDISGIARSFGGGGHKAASGFTLHCSMDKAIKSVKKEIEDLLSKEG